MAAEASIVPSLSVSGMLPSFQYKVFAGLKAQTPQPVCSFFVFIVQLTSSWYLT